MNVLRPTLLLDLDRTLLDTDRFYNAVWTFLEAKYQVDLPAELARAKSFFHYQGELYDYDFRTHLRSLGLDPEQIKKQFLDHYGEESFVFPDAQAALALQSDYTLEILTYGSNWYQLFKLAACAELAALKMTIILESKAVYLQHKYLVGRTILVDDKPLAGYSDVEWPEHVEFIWLNRALDQPVLRSNKGVAIKSLIQLKSVLGRE